jgi:putative transposase
MRNIRENQEIGKLLLKFDDLQNQQNNLFEYLGGILKLLSETRMMAELEDKCGQRYSRNKPYSGRYSRFGSQLGSIKLGIERLPIEVPRIKDNKAEQTFEPESYQKMKDNPPSETESLYKMLIGGLKQREYKKVAKSFEDSFGLSQSNVSKQFIKESEKLLSEYENRSLREYEFIGLFIDGKYFGSREIVHLIGITLTGFKISLGFIESANENSTVIKDSLKRIIRRGFRYKQGILVIADGSKGIKKGVKEVFGRYALYQRCQWHKRENILKYLNESQQKYFRLKLQSAYEEPTYDKAKEKLIEIYNELLKINRSAAQSLMEGLEETLTVHRLGLRATVGKSLTTTNVIESVNSRLRSLIGRITRWQNSKMLHRWVACGLLEIEPGLRRIHNYKKLNLLREAIQNNLSIRILRAA